MNIPDPLPRRWLPSPFLRASAALHLGVAAGVITRPPLWPWALGAVVANHALITASGLWPRSALLGPNWTCLPAHSAARSEVAITIDDGPDPDVTPRVLELLADHGARASFFCVGERVERHAGLARDVVALGHTIENHSQRHRHNFSLLGPGSMHAEIAHAQQSIADVTGSAPRFFRAPAGLRNPFLEPALSSMNLHLASWTRRGFDTVNGRADAVYRRLTASLRGGDILLLHDGNSARDADGQPVILNVLPRLLTALRSQCLEPVTMRAALV